MASISAENGGSGEILRNWVRQAIGLILL